MLNRSLEVKKNRQLDKVLMDRNFAFCDKYDDKHRFDEQININNMSFEIDNIPEYDQKMPMRYGYHTPKINKKKYIEPVHTDFDVFNTQELQVNDELAGYTTNHDNMELKEDKSSYFRDNYKNHIALDESSIYNNVVNEKSFEIMNILRDYVGKKFTISPYNMMLFLSVIFKLSNSPLLKKFFKYNKNIIFDGITNINNKLDRSHIISYNALYYGSHGTINRATKKNLDNIIHICNFNTDRYDKIVTILNKKIELDINQQLIDIYGKEFVHENNSLCELFDTKLVNKNTEILGVNLTYIKSFWDNSFYVDDNAIFYKKIRNGIIEERCKMLIGHNISIKYYSDDKVQHIELDLKNKDLKVGIVLPKKNIELAFTSDKILSNIDKMKKKNMGTVQLPVFKFVTSMKLDKLLVKFGLKSLYEKLIIKDLISEQTKLSNIIQRTIFNIDCYSKCKPSKKHYNDDFIANHSFAYYLRYDLTNTFIIMGYYN